MGSAGPRPQTRRPRHPHGCNSAALVPSSRTRRVTVRSGQHQDRLEDERPVIDPSTPAPLAALINRSFVVVAHVFCPHPERFLPQAKIATILTAPDGAEPFRYLLK